MGACTKLGMMTRVPPQVQIPGSATVSKPTRNSLNITETLAVPSDWFKRAAIKQRDSTYQTCEQTFFFVSSNQSYLHQNLVKLDYEPLIFKKTMLHTFRMF